MGISTYLMIGIAIYVFPRLFLYNREGDIELNVKGIDKQRISSMKTHEVLDRMHELIIYNEKKVRWPFYLAISSVASLFILSLISSNSLSNNSNNSTNNNSTNNLNKENIFFVLTLFIFSLIEIPQRYESAHVRSIQTYESTLLREQFKKLLK